MFDFLGGVWYNRSMGDEKVPQVASRTEDELTPEQEAMLDHIVDTQGCSYDDARRQMGLPVDDPAELRGLVPTIEINPRNNRRGLGGQAVKDVFCGDCLENIPLGEACAHMRVGPRGGRYANDGSRY